MNMVEASRAPSTISCPTCGGAGVVATAEMPLAACSQCGGLGGYGWSSGAWLAWRKTIDELHLIEERLERTVRISIDGALLTLGVVGAGTGVLSAWPTVQAAISEGAWGLPQLMADLWSLRGGGLLVFWLSIVTDLYLFYRFEQRQRISAPIPASSSLEAPPPTTDFGSISSAQTVDVSASYTPAAMTVVERAYRIAARFRHSVVEPLHLLIAAAEEGPIGTALVRLGVKPTALRDRIQRALAKLPQGGATIVGGTTRAVLVRAYQDAQRRHLLQVTPPHLLEALSEVPSVAQEILFDLGAEEAKVQNVVLWTLMQQRLFQSWSRLRQRALTKPRSGMDRAMTAQATPVLEHFSVDLTQLARRGRLPVVVDRERELEDTFRIVESGRHNVILVGEKGVGTTSLLMAIAERMAAEDVPEVLQDKRLVLLSVSGLVSGAGSAGELEARLSEVITEIIKAGNVVLAIEDIHDLVGVSSHSGQSLDLAAILSKVLEGRAFVAFATSTSDGYRRLVEPSALFTAFEKLEVEEVTPEVAVQILESKVGPVEARHRVFFSYAAIEKIVQLSIRYVHDRRLPEKALTLLDEVAAYTRAAKGDGAVVEENDAAIVIGRRTNVNVAAVTEDEATKLLKLEERMHERMVGQDQAVAAVANALRRSRAELRDPHRPIAVFLFMGPTGVGKTELAKTVAEVYFGDENDMTRLDMSEYQDAASIAKLIGAPPGYAGSTGGYLTEAVRTNPFSLVLLDELEKAHPDVLNLFLQVFDDGRLTDALGRTIDFTNTIIIATSNAGTDLIQQRLKEQQPIEVIRTELLEHALGSYFRPEFINRFDDVIVFRPLTAEEIEQIAQLLLVKVARQLKTRGITLRASPEAVRELAQEGFDPIYGARPLRRLLQERVDNALATHLLTGKLSRRDVAVLEPGGVIRVERAAQL